MKQENKGLARAKDIYQDRSRRINELKNEGRKVIGFCCTYAPLEILTACGVVPYWLHGDMKEAVTKGEKGFLSTFCPIMRSCFDVALKGRYDFLDGIISVHSCDPMEKGLRVWESIIPYKYFHYMDLPCKTGSPANRYFKDELNDFKDTLESFTGEAISSDKLRAAIENHNQQRALVRQMYDLNRPDPPLISGVETIQVIKALTSIPVEEGNELLREIIAEVKTRREGPKKRPARILVWSSIIDDIALIEVIEEAGANVVIDDHCGGSRAYRTDVQITENPMDGLTSYYIEQPMCARTFREASTNAMKRDYSADLECRYGYLGDYVKEWSVNGAILQLVRNCDPFGYEVVNAKDYFDSLLHVPNMYLEYNYSWGEVAAIRTRVQAFIEIVSGTI